MTDAPQPPAENDDDLTLDDVHKMLGARDVLAYKLERKASRLQARLQQVLTPVVPEPPQDQRPDIPVTKNGTAATQGARS